MDHKRAILFAMQGNAVLSLIGIVVDGAVRHVDRKQSLVEHCLLP